jgi:hypothetical protein
VIKLDLVLALLLSVWQKGALAGKPYGLFSSTAAQGGGVVSWQRNC